MKFKVDHNYGKQLAEFAAQLEHISHEDQDHILKLFNNDQHPEFYCGLLAGFAGSLVLLDQAPVSKALDSMKVIIAVLASKIRKDEEKLPEWPGPKK